MRRAQQFTFMDGGRVEADSPVALFEKLREAEGRTPVSLEEYLDLLQSRAGLQFGADLDMGPPGSDVPTRCRHALASLINHGWLRLSRPEAAPAPRKKNQGATR